MNQRKSFSSFFLLFTKGAFMGSADIIPGVSGGTVAFISGIYERLISALKSINIVFIYYFFKGFIDRKYFKKAKKHFLIIDYEFLFPLLAGILFAFFILANIVGYAIDIYPTYTFAFFFGLILSSSMYVYLLNKSDLQAGYFFLFLGLGLLFSYFIVGLDSIQAEHSLIIIFASGVISFCAMILPGISGAFILLMLGQYEFMLNVLRNLTHLDLSSLPYALCFGIGGLLGLLGFSRVLSYFIKNYRMQTLSFILGIMIGALRKPGEYIIHNWESGALTVLSIFVGIGVVFIFSYYDFTLKRSLIKK
jgi:putative membrane protein